MSLFSQIGKKKKNIIKYSMAVFFMVATLVILFSIFDNANSRRMASKYLIAVTEGVTKTMDSWINDKKNLLALISTSPEIKAAFIEKEFRVSERLDRITAYYYHLENVFLVSTDGEVFTAAGTGKDFSNLQKMEFWERFKASGYQPYLDTYVRRSPKTGKLSFMLVQGVFSNSGELLGFAGFNINWDKFIKQFIIPVKVGETGYLAITDTIGRNIGHHDLSLNLKELTNYPWMQKIIDEKNGFQRYYFKDKIKLMSFRQSDEVGWIINASIDENELIQSTNRLRNIILIACVILLLLSLFSIIYLDLFKLEKAEQDLSKSKRNFKLLFDRGSDGLFFHEITHSGEIGYFTKVNKAFLTLFEIPATTVLSLTPHDLFKSTGKDDYANLIKEIIKTKHQIVEMELKGNDNPFYVEFRLFLVESQREYAILGFVRDITDRIVAKQKLKEDRDYLNKRVHERTQEISLANKQLRKYIKEKEIIAKALSESEVKYRSLIDRANDGIMLIFHKKISFVNPKICSLLKFEKEQLTGMAFEEIISEDSRKWVMDNHDRRLQGIAVPDIFETKLITSDGEPIEVEINAGVINDEEGQKDFLFIRDITLRKKNEAERQKTREQLIQTDKLIALGTLVSGVAHEINNPNNAIMLNNPIVKEAWENTKPILEKYRAENGDFIISGMPYSFFNNYFEDIIDDIQKSSEKIKTIVEDLKNFSRPDTGSLCDEVEINMIIRSAVKLLSNQLCCATANFSFHPDHTVPPINGNFVRLEQVFVNLLQNACHSLTSHDEAIVVTTLFLPEEKVVEIVVCDQGEGISEENLKQIFDPFFTTKRDKGGTGLGLSVSLKIIKEHQGSISFRSKEGEGTVVTVKLPIKNENDGKSETDSPCFDCG